MPIFSRPIVPRSRIKNRLLVLSTLLSLTLLFYLNNRGPALPAATSAAVNFPPSPPPPLSVHDVLFSIASSSSSLPRRIPYIRLWCDPISVHNNTFIFLDRPTTEATNPSSIPPIVLSSKSSPNLPSGYRIALIVKDAVTLDIPNIHCDARIFACLSELGVGLTPEPGFHQVDVRGNLFGFLAAHPLSPLLSLHHMEAVEPIFPGMSRIQSLEHLFKAVQVDPAKVLQQTVCYDHANSLTISIAWGYAVQIYEGNKLLLDILSLQKSFRPWRRGKNVDSSHYMFNTREFPRDPCKRPAVFFMDTVVSDTNQVWTSYTKRDVDSCVRLKAIEKLKVIRVLSPKLDFDIEQLKTPRRHCCDISPSFDEKMVVQIRQCGMDELVTMRT
ncbi:uncharacterized protein LOC111389732 isoform X3 [Olea europaea var. sylvestris]|uniref:uncharacterized protein LOC111389732 isoform X3 n=1 Tax=Olea europaea var. sylvestris TaxID=158386 RepID=UPI000C1CE7EE|nr:uncharacterized protein LOC111389732 isoform X3 [Olea europaea var. sylvestris]